MYRTGDRARFWPDGNIEFLGRLDEQVKIHGFRIELGEIETALVGHPDVRSAIVVARTVPGGKMLVAYIEPANNRTVSSIEVRAYLAARLPDYMVPAAVIVLDALPMTGSGGGPQGCRCLRTGWTTTPSLRRRTISTACL